MEIKTNKPNTKKTKNSKTKQIETKKVHKNATDLLLCWQRGMWTTLKCGWYIQGDAIGENWFFLCQWISVVVSFLFRGERPYLVPPLSARIPSDLNLCRPCVWCHSIVNSYVHQTCCLWKMLFPWSQPSGFYNPSDFLLSINSWIMRGRVWWKHLI